MIGSFLTRALVMVFGYAYPAYECYKVVELNKPEIEQLRFWCQYWILVAVLTVFERVGDAFISWLPMYSEAKLAFYIYLWYPKTKGTAYVYDTFFRPYVAKHETEIDRNLLELRTRAGDMVLVYWQRAANYGQTRFFEILQYVASQSPSQSSRARPAQQRQQTDQTPSAVAPGRQPAISHHPEQLAVPGRQPAISHHPEQPAVPVRQPAVSHQPQQPTVSGRQPATSQQSQQSGRAPPSPVKSQLQEPTNAGIPQPAVLSAARPQTSSGLAGLPSSETPGFPVPNEEAMEIEVASTPMNEDSNLPPQETAKEEAIRVTRGRLRKRAAGADGLSTR